MIVTFHNLTVHIEALDPAEAYDLLCDGLANIEFAQKANGATAYVDWDSDTYSTDDTDDLRSTTELFPDSREPR